MGVDVDELTQTQQGSQSQAQPQPNLQVVGGLVDDEDDQLRSFSSNDRDASGDGGGDDDKGSDGGDDDDDGDEGGDRRDDDDEGDDGRDGGAGMTYRPSRGRGTSQNQRPFSLFTREDRYDHATQDLTMVHVHLQILINKRGVRGNIRRRRVVPPITQLTWQQGRLTA